MSKNYEVLNELVPKTQELHRAIFDKGYEQGQRDMVDKIRTEILRHSYEGFELGSFRDGYNSALVEVLNIIDKYKIEVRDKHVRCRIKDSNATNI